MSARRGKNEDNGGTERGKSDGLYQNGQNINMKYKMESAQNAQ